MAILGDIYRRNAAQAPLDERPIGGRTLALLASVVSYEKRHTRGAHYRGKSPRSTASARYWKAHRDAERQYCRRMVG